MSTIDTLSAETIQSEKELRQLIKPYPKMLDKRIQTSFDKYSNEFIGSAKTVALMFSENRLGCTFVDLTQSPIVFMSDTQCVIRLEVKGANSLIALRESLNFSMYFLIPGVGHGLRVNGQVNIEELHEECMNTAVQLTLNIASIYFQCARAAVRSSLWDLKSTDVCDEFVVETNNHLSENTSSFARRSPYLFLRTENEVGQTELSPRGDPHSMVTILNNKQILIPERPGNKVAISLRNIISTGKVALSFLFPGSHNVLFVTGQARVITCEKLLKTMAINGKEPKVGILVDIDHVELNHSHGIASADIWNQKKHTDVSLVTPFSKALSAHMNGDGLLGRAATPIINAVVKKDLKRLY